LDLTKDDTAIFVVDASKCGDLILELINNDSEERGCSVKTLDEQIIETEKEYYNYKKNNYSSPHIIEWLESVLLSLKELNELKNGKERNKENVV
jgi:hypothetical protein